MSALYQTASTIGGVIGGAVGGAYALFCAYLGGDSAHLTTLGGLCSSNCTVHGNYTDSTLFNNTMANEGLPPCDTVCIYACTGIAVATSALGVLSLASCVVSKITKTPNIHAFYEEEEASSDDEGDYNACSNLAVGVSLGVIPGAATGVGLSGPIFMNAPSIPGMILGSCAGAVVGGLCGYSLGKETESKEIKEAKKAAKAAKKEAKVIKKNATLKSAKAAKKSAQAAKKESKLEKVLSKAEKANTKAAEKAAQAASAAEKASLELMAAEEAIFSAVACTVTGAEQASLMRANERGQRRNRRREEMSSRLEEV